MRIVEINVTSGNGSTGRIASDIAIELEKRGHEVIIAYGRDDDVSGLKTYRIGSNFDVYVHALTSRIFDNVGFASKKATYRFVELLREIKPEVVHVHNLHGYYINVEILFNYLKESNTRIVWTMHDCWPITGHCSHFDSVNCEQWKHECVKCPKKIKNKYPKCYFEPRCNKNFNKKKELFTEIDNMVIVTPSKWLNKFISQSFLNKYESIVIYNGIDKNIFKPTKGNLADKYNINGKKIILGVANVWTVNKGFNDFIELSYLLDDDQIIVLIGVDDNQIKKLPKNIIGIKKTQNLIELAEWYTISDVFFNPTYEDNFPTVNLEAQSCGTPVITYNTGGSIESVPCENVIEQGNYKKIIDILKKDNLKIISDAFDKKHMIEDYVKIIESQA